MKEDQARNTKQPANIIMLGCAIGLQAIILVGLLVQAAMPLWTGQEVRVKIMPVDPRSMFRGNYVQLNYGIGQLPENALDADINKPRIGEVIYVILKADANNVYHYAKATLEKPSQGIFLRGHITHNTRPYRVKYGIEAFFKPKEKTLELEQQLRKGGIAVIMVSASGKAALKDVVIQ